MNKPKIFLEGKRFGRLTVIRINNKFKKRTYLCKCDCGGDKNVLAYSLINGGTKSCGCLWTESNRSPFKDGLLCGGIPKEYRVYKSMINRCYNKKQASYRFYGQKGIKVCDRWLKSFKNFIEDVGPRPGNDYSIDRIDPKKDYGPDNCRWATAKQQSNNRTNTIFITYKGENITIYEFSERTGIAYKSIYYKIKSGWTPDEIEINSKSL